jgi:AcrR family transcriptional regulator
MPAAARREQLLDAALAVIIERGYGGVSVESVARAGGVTRPVIYDHFPNLGALLGALIEREERYAVEQLEQILPDERMDQMPGELLAQGLRRFLDAVASRPTTWRLILLPLEGTPVTVRQHIEAQRAWMLGRIEHFVRLERPQAGFDVQLAARTIRDLGEQAGRMVLTDPQGFSPERYERFVKALVQRLWPGAEG